MSKLSLREKMPGVTEFIDALRESFGKDLIDVQIRKGLKGEPVFWASENGHELGTRNTVARSLVMWDDQGRAYSVDIPAGVSPGEERELCRFALEKANARLIGQQSTGSNTDE